MKNIVLCMGIIGLAITGYAQNPYGGEAKVTFDQTVQNRDRVELKANIDLSGLRLGRNEQITFTPELRSLDGTHRVVLDAFTVSGKRKAKSMRRKAYFGDEVLPAQMRVVRCNDYGSNIAVEKSVAYERWMLASQLVVVETTTGCGDNVLTYADGLNYKTYTAGALAFTAPRDPDFAVQYMPAPVVETKIMQETYSARLGFRSGKSELLRQYGSNERVLDEVDEIITRVKNDSLLTIRRILVRGYASPEGGAATNQRLSEGRARAFVTYLHFRHNFYQADKSIHAEGMGEDWQGLRKAVEERSYLDDRQRVLDIIDNTENIERRKAQIRALSGGRTYKMMLEDIYPALRRNEYTIEYQIRGFGLEEAKAVFGTRPQLLSLEELFMVANSYEHDTQEYRQVFVTAGRLYPDSEVVQFNIAAMQIENGLYDAAIRSLEKFDTPEALNNIGIAYWNNKEYEKAQMALVRAAESGSVQAAANLAELRRWLDESGLQ